MAPFTAQQQPLDSYPLPAQTLAPSSRVVNIIISPDSCLTHDPPPLLADGTRVPMATVQFAAMTAALLAGWMGSAGLG
jgi:hypothetical protein